MRLLICINRTVGRVRGAGITIMYRVVWRLSSAIQNLKVRQNGVLRDVHADKGKTNPSKGLRGDGVSTGYVLYYV